MRTHLCCGINDMVHIVKERIDMLVKDEILWNLDFIDFCIYISCIKGKPVRSNKTIGIRSSGLLGLIHTYICGKVLIFLVFRVKNILSPLLMISHNLLREKSNSLNTFKVFKAEMENQLDIKIKVVRSNTGSEYYSRYDDMGRNPDPCARGHCSSIYNAQNTTID